MTKNFNLPELSYERLEQMIHFATSLSQEERRLPWYQRLHLRSHRLAYGLGAAAVSFSCAAAFLLMPLFTLQSELAPAELSVSEYMMQDLLEDLG